MKSKEVPMDVPGNFVIGCNYWASHAGTQMWSDWRPDIIERDLKLIKSSGMEVIRVFPLWPDFQPIKAIRTGSKIVEYRLDEEPLPDDACGQAGMSAFAIEKFACFLDLLKKYKLKCIVGLITGWMSGRLFVPPALEGLNVLVDPIAMRWQARFIKYFVGRFRGHQAIVGWDLGNECNCMGIADRNQAYIWTSVMTDAIRSIDTSRIVISGMHSLTPSGAWSIFDQGELTDLLTVHPYPVFTPYADQDPVNTIRTTLHGTAEARFYSDLSGKPCLCEEIGTLGPIVANEKIKADFLRVNLYSLWANDCHGLLWWCANDQTLLKHAPYDWCAPERELGLFRVDGSAKPVVAEFSKFQKFRKGLPFKELPLRSREAVCILTEGQDHWAIAYSSFVLSKQAGFDIEFQHASQPLKEADVYFLPSLKGHRMIDRRRMLVLLARVRKGATLYLSLDDGLPSEFEEIVGLVPAVREKRKLNQPLNIKNVGENLLVENAGEFNVRYDVTRAKILGCESDGNPLYTVSKYGKGKVYFLAIPIEMALSRTPGGFHSITSQPWWRIYEIVAKSAIEKRAVKKTYSHIAVTEHKINEFERIVVAINHTPLKIRESLELGSGWSLMKIYRGKVKTNGVIADITIEENDSLVFSIKKLKTK